MKDELREALGEPHDEARAHRNWEAIARRRRPTPAVGRAPVVRVGLGLALAAAVTLAVVSMPQAPGALRLPDGREARGLLAHDATLDDGSRITLGEGAHLEVLENAGDHVRFWLHEGVARFDVVPGGPRRWAIETGLVTVEVLGTAFTVTRTLREVTVAVDRGTVLVRGPTAPDGMQRLTAGQSVTIPAEVVAVAETESGRVSATESEEEEETATEATTEATVETEEETETGTEVRAEGEAVAEAEAATARSRLHEVDALRGAGRIDDAIALLDTIASDPSAGRERALAAFTRGRLELDRRDHPEQAALAFEQAVSLGLREPLLEDAEARLVEARARAGDGAGAASAATEYRRLYPAGRWSAQVDRWSAPP